MPEGLTRDLVIAASGCAAGFSIAYVWNKTRNAAQIEALTLRVSEAAAGTPQLNNTAADLAARHAEDAAKSAKEAAAAAVAITEELRAELLALSALRKVETPSMPRLIIAAPTMKNTPRAPSVKEDDNGSVSAASARTDAGYVTADDLAEEPTWLQEAAEAVPEAGWSESPGRPYSPPPTSAPGESALLVAAKVDADGSPAPSIDDVASVVASQADALFAACSHSESLVLLEDGLNRMPDSAALLWRAARCHKKLADAAANPARARHMEEAMRLARAALEMGPQLAPAHKWFAIMLGSSPASTSEKITSSFVIREHFDEAAVLDPHDATARHLLGLWCFEVAKLSWIEKRAAAALFAAPPEATYEEAYAHLAHAERLEPGFYAPNTLLLAKCANELGRREEARRWLRACMAIAPRDADEEKACKEASTLRF